MDVRITLLEPWALDRDGKEVSLLLRYGSSPAREVSAGGQLRIAGEIVASDDLVDAGSHMDVDPRPQRTVIAGRRIEWEFNTALKDKNDYLIPLECARLYFGDHRFPKNTPHNAPPDETYNYERTRIAMKWGNWQMPMISATGKPHLDGGRERPDTTKIGSPKIPHVRIQSVDNRGRATKQIDFTPWDWFRWQDDVLPTSASSMQPGPAIQSFTAADLRRIADEIEAREKTAKG